MSLKGIIISSILVVLLIFIQPSRQASEGITGAVVNYEPVWLNNKPDMWNFLFNTEAYCGFIIQAAKADADIIVFPAEGLRGTSGHKMPLVIPNISEKFNPSTLNDSNYQVLSLLSRCAKTGDIYVVLTVDELVDQQTCLTQIVFDRDGTIVARNRGVRCRNGTNTEEEIFTLYDKYRVALILNDDVYLEERTQELGKQQINYYAMSYDLMETHPFATAVQTQWWWSFGNNKPLLAAGLHEQGRSGSGLYIGRKLGLPKMKDGHKPGDILIVGKVPLLADTPPSTYSQIWDDPVMQWTDRKEDTIVIPRKLRDTVTAFSEAYVSIDKRDINELDEDQLANYTKLMLNVNYMKTDHEKQMFLVEEELCSGELCCTFKMKWNVRVMPRKRRISIKDLLTKVVSRSNSSDEGHKVREEGCYLLVVGDTKEELNKQGIGNVKRCAVVYTSKLEYCQSVDVTTSSTLQETSSKSSWWEKKLFNFFTESHHFNREMKHLPLNRTNAALHKLQIVANQKNLTPNILLANGIELAPHTGSFIYKDLPVSRLFVKKTFHRFVTLGIQNINNYVPN